MLSQMHKIAFCKGNLLAELFSKFDIPKKKIIIDFSSPNIAKIFHVGNLRSTIYGNYLQKICRSAGHDVVSVNYLGDWGQQNSLLAFYWMAVMGENTKPETSKWSKMNAEEKMKILMDAYVAANKMSKVNSTFFAKVRRLHVGMEKQRLGIDVENLQEKLEANEAIKLWEEWAGISREYLEGFYSRFGVHFDVWDSESAHVKEGAKLVDEFIEKGICKLNKDESTWIINNIGPGKELIALRRGDGANIYLNRELACIYARHKQFNADQYIYVVDKNQSNHFVHLKQLLKLRGDEELANRIYHHSYGRVIGLSSREGKVDAVDFLIDQGKLEAEAYVDSSFTKKSDSAEKELLCRKLARSQLVFDLVRRGKDNDFTFTYRGAFTPEGKNALKLQEKYSRLNSLELNAHEHMEMLRTMSESELAKLRPEMADKAQKLARMITEFDTVLNNSLAKMATAPIITYLDRLSSVIGGAMAELRVMGEPRKIALPRMLLFSAAKKVLGEGMELVCIEPIERI